MRTHLIFLAVLSQACGYTSGGGGTGTLFVTARLTSDGSTVGSTARVMVREGTSTGDFVGDATVAIRGGPLQRTLVPFDPVVRQYQLDGFSWVDGLRLEILRGKDFVDGSIDTPGATLIVDPVADSTFKRADGQPLVIRWKDARNASAKFTRARVDGANVDRPIPEGTFELRLDPNELSATGKERIRVERTNEVDLVGAASGSVLSATTEHRLEFRVE
jgi:hypothetical protein